MIVRARSAVVSSSDYPRGRRVALAVLGDGPSVVELAFTDQSEIPACVDLADHGAR